MRDSIANFSTPAWSDYQALWTSALLLHSAIGLAVNFLGATYERQLHVPLDLVRAHRLRT